MLSDKDSNSEIPAAWYSIQNVGLGYEEAKAIYVLVELISKVSKKS